MQILHILNRLRVAFFVNFCSFFTTENFYSSNKTDTYLYAAVYTKTCCNAEGHAIACPSKFFYSVNVRVVVCVV